MLVLANGKCYEMWSQSTTFTVRKVKTAIEKQEHSDSTNLHQGRCNPNLNPNIREIDHHQNVISSC